MYIVCKDASNGQNVKLFEFQGSFEALHLFDGVFDEQTLQMKFKGFFLQGRLVDKKFTILQKGDDGQVESIGKTEQVVLFDGYPQYIISQ